MSLQADMGTFDTIYLAFRKHGQSDLYLDAIRVISDQAAIYRSVQMARGIGGVLATIATPPDTLDRDLATLRVDNAADANQCRRRTEDACKELGVPEILMTELSPQLDRLVGAWLPGEKNRRYVDYLLPAKEEWIIHLLRSPSALPVLFQ